MQYPWISLYEWQPFRVDALGLITLLGAEEINNWVGRLVPSRWMEYMPLLAMYVIAGDRFRARSASYSLYNISSGIFTTECAPWFTRWIHCQNFKRNRMIVSWEVSKMPQKRRLLDNSTAIFVSVCFTGLLLIASILARDFYGTANASAIVISILARSCILHANRAAIDRDVLKAKAPKGPEKLIIITPDANVITMFIPNELIIRVFTRNSRTQPSWLYNTLRWISWIAFGVHVTTLGMASLVNQIYSIGLILVSSILVWKGFGCEDMVQPTPVGFTGGGYSRAYTCWIGSYLKATIFEWPSYLEFEQSPEADWRFRTVELQPDMISRPTRRMDLFAWLNLTDEEETSFSKWNLLPHERHGDTSWQEAFDSKRTLIRERCPDIQQIKACVDMGLGGKRPKVQQQKDDVESCSGDTDEPVGFVGIARSQSDMGTTNKAWGHPPRSQSAPPK
ncbi:unnamed protein product [Penicillium olsonii]|nr:unnamed protein product [Penicillium olsonii]CAG7919807.1 unnamed protein product [Penicillium olsonii]